jgi:hypothetical protein
LEHFKAAYDNKTFTLSHFWILIKDSKKWEDSFTLWEEIEAKKKGNGNASTSGFIKLDDKGVCLGNPAGDGLAFAGCARRPPSARLSRPASQKEEAIAEREERWRKDKKGHR